MSSTTCLITGATSGIGLAAARDLASRGWRLLVVARSSERGEEACRAIGPTAEPLVADLASQAQVRALAGEVRRRTDRLDVLVNNAGLTVGDHQLTEDGVEMTFAVNHLAPFLLTVLLRELLVASAPARVVTVASAAHRGHRLDLAALARREWSTGWRAYGESKLANILFTRELARRLEGTGVVATCLHPGVVRTGFARQGPLAIRWFFKLAGLFLLSPEQGAETLVHLATSEQGGRANGGYFVRCRQAQPTDAARDDRVATGLWELSERLTGLA